LLKFVEPAGAETLRNGHAGGTHSARIGRRNLLVPQGGFEQAKGCVPTDHHRSPSNAPDEPRQRTRAQIVGRMALQRCKPAGRNAQERLQNRHAPRAMRGMFGALKIGDRKLDPPIIFHG
jgi:hypothetical protein